MTTLHRMYGITIQLTHLLAAFALLLMALRGVVQLAEFFLNQ